MARMMLLRAPESAPVLAAVGKVAIQHGHLDYILRMMVKTLATLELGEALGATRRQSTSALHKRVRALALRRLGEGRTLCLIDNLLNRARDLSRRRNELLHGLWAAELDGGEFYSAEDGKWIELPQPSELEALAEEIRKLRDEMNHARLDGFISEALAQRPQK